MDVGRKESADIELEVAARGGQVEVTGTGHDVPSFPRSRGTSVATVAKATFINTHSLSPPTRSTSALKTQKTDTCLQLLGSSLLFLDFLSVPPYVWHPLLPS